MSPHRFITVGQTRELGCLIRRHQPACFQGERLLDLGRGLETAVPRFPRLASIVTLKSQAILGLLEVASRSDRVWAIHCQQIADSTRDDTSARALTLKCHLSTLTGVTLKRQ
jgi:hypothetical protein